VVRTAFAILFLTLFEGMPAQAQEALAIGLKGHVHTLLTEEFTTEGGVRESRDSTLDVYEQAGYELEFFRYKPDGSLWVHTINSRNGWQILKIQTFGTAVYPKNLVAFDF
jgi:hypothetical protein